MENRLNLICSFNKRGSRECKVDVRKCVSDFGTYGLDQIAIKDSAAKAEEPSSPTALNRPLLDIRLSFERRFRPLWPDEFVLYKLVVYLQVSLLFAL